MARMNQARYIAVEGPIGAGKTTLAKLLADRFGARLELEDIEANPFLKGFYRDRRGLAFKTQVFFLLSRYQHQQELWQQDLFNRMVVSDYLFVKDLVFAYLNLDDHELPLYEQIYKILEPRVIKPDLIIYLQADTEVLMKRVRKRGYLFEKELDLEYLEKVRQGYNSFFFHYYETPLLIVNTTEIDFVENKEEADRLIKEISSMNRGTLYFNPLRSSFLD